MIIFINGSYGVGKTTVATELASRLPESLIFDPEEVGYMLRSILKPVAWTGDSQDYEMWRTLVPEVAAGLLRGYRRVLIMPMTIWRADYFEQVMTGLRAVEPRIYHCCLTAPLHVLHDRLRSRGGQTEGDWSFQQAEKCVVAFESDLFDERIDTSSRNASEVADYISSRCSSMAAEESFQKTP